MPKNISENKQEPSESDREETIEKKKKKKAWKDIINLPDDLDLEVH